MTKSQERHFVRIWIGSLLFHKPIELENENDDNTESLNKLRKDKINNLLKSDPAFGETEAIKEYVIKKYK